MSDRQAIQAIQPAILLLNFYLYGVRRRQCAQPFDGATSIVTKEI